MPSDDYLNRNLPTDSAEEAEILAQESDHRGITYPSSDELYPKWTWIAVSTKEPLIKCSFERARLKPCPFKAFYLFRVYLNKGVSILTS